MRHFGIDLGTSTCSVSYAVNSARPNYVPPPEVVLFRNHSESDSKSAAVPSVVARTVVSRKGKEDTAVIVYGFEAEKAVLQKNVTGRNFHTIFRSVKSHLGTGRSYVRADSSLNSPVKVWGALIRRLCEMTVEQKGDADFDPRKHQTVLTVPASFGRAQRDDTLAAAKLAGFDVDTPGRVQLIDEPVAALIDTLHNSPELDLNIVPDKWNTLLVFDFGGGTCDLVVLKVRYDATKPDGLEVLPQSISPYHQIGGDTIDLAIMEKVVWPQVCKQLKLSREELAANEKKHIEDVLRYEVCRRLKQSLNEKLWKLPAGDFQAEKWAGVSETWSMSQCLVRNKELRGTAKLTADELNEVMAPFLELDTDGEPFRVGESSDCYPFATLVERTLERAGMTSDDLDLIVLHGGSCYSPFIPRLFEQMREKGILKDACKVIRTPDLTTSVARGAAIYGRLSAKHRKPYIPPIVPEDLSILTEGGSCEVLVHAGTQLPVTKTFSGKKQFYLSENGQHEITLPIYVGYDDQRRRASTLSIPIKQTLEQSHPVEVELTINEDKISRWRCRPVGFDWCEVVDVANPWIGEEPSEEVENLQTLRESIRSSVEKGVKLKAGVLLDEALAAAKADFTEEGMRLVEDVLNEHPNDANGWNIKGLIHGMRGEQKAETECYKQATTLAPDRLVFLGNYGVALHQTKRHAEAIEVMRDALARNRSLTYLHSWLVNAFFALNDFVEMKKELERWHAHTQQKALQNPDDVKALEEFAITAARLGQYDEAADARKRIHQLKRDRNLLAGPGHG